MYAIPEQLVAFNKSNIHALLDYTTLFADNAEKLAQFQFQCSQAALAEPFAVVLHALGRAGIEAGNFKAAGGRAREHVGHAVLQGVVAVRRVLAGAPVAAHVGRDAAGGTGRAPGDAWSPQTRPGGQRA